MTVQISASAGRAIWRKVGPALGAILRPALGGALLALLGAQAAWALGGTAVSEGESLSLRTVMVLNDRGGACTGTVVGRRSVLTAAHCVAGGARVAVAYFEAGSPVLQETNARAFHPDYSRNARVSIDMALVRLKEPLPARFSAAALDGSAHTNDLGAAREIAGFGLARDGDEKSAGTLRRGEVVIQPKLYPRFLRLSSAGGRVAICKGDSGGPVYDSAAGLLVGVVYAKEKAPGIHACGLTAQAVRIAPQRAWLDATLAKFEGFGPYGGAGSGPRAAR